MSVTYIGSTDVDDINEPLFGKSEWGLDEVTREVSGSIPKVKSYIDKLKQGDSYEDYFLQTWVPTAHRSFPVLSLRYLGLLRGLPDPQIINRTSQQFIPNLIFFTGPQVWSVAIAYYAPETIYRYITKEKPTGPKYTKIDATDRRAEYRIVAATEDGTVSQLSPEDQDYILALMANQGLTREYVASWSSERIYGTPYYACEDIVQRIYIGE